MKNKEKKKQKSSSFFIIIKLPIFLYNLRQLQKKRHSKRENYYWRVPENIKLIQCTHETRTISRLTGSKWLVYSTLRLTIDMMWNVRELQAQRTNYPCVVYVAIFVSSLFRVALFFRHQNQKYRCASQSVGWSCLCECVRKEEANEQKKKKIHRFIVTLPSDHELMIFFFLCAFVLYAKNLDQRLAMVWKNRFFILFLPAMYLCVCVFVWNKCANNETETTKNNTHTQTVFMSFLPFWLA